MTLKRGQKMLVDRFVNKRLNGFERGLIGHGEDDFAELLKYNGLIEGKDFIRQHLYHSDDILIVVDFSFPHYGIVVEIDGKSHDDKTQQQLDKLRDRICAANGLKSIRIKHPMTHEQKQFWGAFFRCTKEDAENDTLD